MARDESLRSWEARRRPQQVERRRRRLEAMLTSRPGHTEPRRVERPAAWFQLVSVPPPTS
jgi:hypothetical protein